MLGLLKLSRALGQGCLLVLLDGAAEDAIRADAVGLQGLLAVEALKVVLVQVRADAFVAKGGVAAGRARRVCQQTLANLARELGRRLGHDGLQVRQHARRLLPVPLLT